jgi:hypothetical protein
MAVGCGSNASKTDGGSSGAGCAAMGAYCDRLAACAPGWMAISGFPDAASCKTYYVAQCNAELAAPQTGLTSSLAQQCGEVIAAASCGAFLSRMPFSSACIPRGGTIPNGASCGTSWQCASGSCFGDSPTNLGSCGTCVPSSLLNQACDSSICADGLHCARTSTSGTTPVCTEPVAMGGTCVDTTVCPADGYCDPTTNVCTKLPAVGQPCNPSAVVYCDPTQAGALCDATSSTCEAIPSPDGGGCSTSPDAGRACSGVLSVGSACTPSDDVCAIGSACTGGVCTLCGGSSDGAAPPASVVRRSSVRLRGVRWMPGSPL